MPKTKTDQTDGSLHKLLRARDWQDRPEFEEVCDWWKNTGYGVFALVGIGGAGKTAVVDRFLRVLPGGYPELPSGPEFRPVGDAHGLEQPPPKRADLPETVQPFIFSFYDVPNVDSFFERMGEWLAEVAEDCRPAAIKPDVDLRRLSVGHVAQWLQNLTRPRERTLLILDGLEKMQDDGRRSGWYGHIPDGRLRSLLLEAAEGRLGRLAIVITTRFDLYDPQAEGVPYYRWLDIVQLDAESCVRLLRTRGVLERDDSVLRRLAEEHGRHALTVDLIGGYIGEFCGGDVSRLKPLGEIDLSDLDDELDPRARALIEQERRFARVAQRYRDSFLPRKRLKWLPAFKWNVIVGEPASLALLERLCLFRRGVNADTLASIFTGDDEKTTRVAGRALAGLTPEQLQKTLDRLVAMKLVEASETSSPSSNEVTYSIHPAVRDGFLSGLDADTAQQGHEAARTGLTAVLGDAPGQNPSDPATLDLLEDIVHHTLHSGHAPEAWDVYWNRIGAYKNLGWRLGAYERGERICREFADGETPETVARLFESCDPDSGGRGFGRAASEGGAIGSAGASPSHYLRLPEDSQVIFINEWALYLHALGRLTAAARCYECGNEPDYRNENWTGASLGTLNLCELWILSGHLLGSAGGLLTAAEALRLAERVDRPDGLMFAYGYQAHARALYGEVPDALADFRAALDWQHKIEAYDQGPLSSLGGIWQAHLLTRLGRYDEARRLTEANKEVLTKYLGTSFNIPKCNIILSDLPGESFDQSARELLCTSARDWALARDAKDVLCWSALVLARIELSGISDQKSTKEDELAGRLCAADTSVTEGLKIARDCGYGLYHIDLLLERARLCLLEGDPQSALNKIAIALDDGIAANEQTGQPELLAANHKECGYAWAIPAGLLLRAEAQLLRAAQIIGERTYKPRSSKTPAEAKELIKQAKSNLRKAMSRWKKLHDPKPERPDQNFRHPKTGEAYNFRAAETFQILEDLGRGQLTRYPIESASAKEPTPIDVRGAKTMQKTVLVIDMVGYSTVCAMLEDALDAAAITQLNEQIQSFVDVGLKAIGADREQAVNQTTGDGAILVLDRPTDTHRFAQAVHDAAREVNRTKDHLFGKRVFRIGGATGPLDMTPKDGGGDDIAGMAIARAVRLEGKSTPGGILIDQTTFDGLTAAERKGYAKKESVRGKRNEVFDAYRCVLDPDAEADVEGFMKMEPPKISAPTPTSTPSPTGRGQRALKLWIEKLDYLLEQEPIIIDPAQKFALRKQIEEAEQKIEELGG